MLRKNVASQVLCFAGVNATTGAALTGASWTGRKSLDGTFSSLTATVTEDTGTGFYKVALAQGDTNANDCAYFFTATNAVPVCINALTTAADPSDSVRLGLTALPNAAAEASGGLITRGTSTGQLSVSSGQVILQSGTGTGQLDFTSGVVKANATQINSVATTSVTTVSAHVGTTAANTMLDAASVRSAVGLASANLDTQLDALPTGAENATAVWGKTLETGFDATRIFRIIAAATAGKVTGEPGSPVFRDLQDANDMITGTADANGNRSAATYGS